MYVVTVHTTHINNMVWGIQEDQSGVAASGGGGNKQSYWHKLREMTLEVRDVCVYVWYEKWHASLCGTLARICMHTYVHTYTHIRDVGNDSGGERCLCVCVE